MIPTANGRPSARRYSFERELAPHLEGKWAEDFVLELRLLGVPGPQIGAAVAEADSHCAESGHTALAAFGDPVAYARSLDLPVEPNSPRSLLGAVAPALAQVLGMLMLLWTFADWLRGERLQLTTGHLAATGVLLVAVLLLALFADRVLRAGVNHPVLGWFAFTVGWVLLVVLTVLLDGVVARLPAIWGMSGGAVLLAAGVLWELVVRRRGGVEDPIRSPFTGASATSGTRWLGAAGWLTIPIWTVVLLAAMWLFIR